MPTTAPDPSRPAAPDFAEGRVSVRRVPGLSDPAVAQVVRVGGHVYVSGQLGIDEQGQVVGAGDCYAQSVQCFRNLDAILRSAGADLGDVVKLVCYLTDKSDVTEYARARSQFLQRDAATTAVVVKELLLADALLELDATAVLTPLSASENPKGAR